MHIAGDHTTCHLRIQAPATLRGSILRVTAGRSVVGRAQRSQVLIDSPDVSRTHAAMTTGRARRRSKTSARPTARPSTGSPCTGPGPCVTATSSASAPLSPCSRTGTPPIRPPRRTYRRRRSRHQCRPAPPTPPPVRYDIGDQRAGTINNVARDQYVYRRESFLREVAASKTRARRLIAVGALLFVAGFVAMAAVLYQFGVDFNEAMASDLDASQQPDVPELAFPVAVLATLVSGLGVVLMVVGVVLHVMATARRRRVEPAYPHPPRSGR